jgi:hypothetical protein
MPTNTTEAFDGTINPSTITNFLHITNKGYHTIKIENGAVAGSVLFQGFVVRSFRDFANGNIIDDTTFQPTLAGTTATGNPTYNTRVSRLKKMGNLINHFVTMNITVDATLAGSVYVLLSNKVENLTNLKVFVPIYQGHGIFTDSTVVTGVMFANSQYLYLQKIVNGVVSNLTGADIQGKTIELTFTAIYTSI